METIIRDKFEAWFVEHYEWFIRRERRGYKLTRDKNGEYEWDIPKHDYQVFKDAFIKFSEIDWSKV